MHRDKLSPKPLPTKSIKKRIRFQGWRNIFLWSAVVVCALIILYLISLGQYIRPFQDDFYYYGPITQKEMYDLLHERFTWTGRFTSTTLQLVVGWSGTHWIVPLISFSVMIAGIYSLFRVISANFFKISQKAGRKLALLAALGLALALFLVTPSPYSSMFWLSAAPIHFWSYGLILLYGAYVLKRILNKAYKWKALDYIIMTIAPIIIGMMGEIAMFTLAAFTGSLLLYAIIYKSKKLAVITIPNFVGLAVAFYALFFSLGAVIRRGAEGAQPFSEVAAHAPYVVIKNLHALVFHLMNNKIILVSLFLLALVLGMYVMRRIVNVRRTLLFVAIITFVCGVLMCLNFVGVYSSVKLNVAWSRTQTFSTIVVIGLIMLYGTVIGALLREYMTQKGKQKLVKQTTQGILGFIALLIVLNLAFLPYIGRFAGSIQDRAVVYDEREASIYQMKKEGAVICPIKLPVAYLVGTQENMDLFEDPAHAVNAGVVRYYRLPCQIIGK